MNPSSPLLRRAALLLAGALAAILTIGTAASPVHASGTPVAAGDAGAAVNVGFGTSLPAIPPGVTVTGMSAGVLSTVLLLSDGTAVATAYSIPALPAGTTYTSVGTGLFFAVLTRSDGTVVGAGSNDYGQLVFPPAPPGMTYTAVDGGQGHSVALRSDGTAVAVGWNVAGQTNIPALPAGMTYTAVAAGLVSTLLLRSDGALVGAGLNAYDIFDIPAVPAGVTYTAIAMGNYHALLLRSDGIVVGTGWNEDAQIDIPALPAGLTYTAVAAGDRHSVLLRSDGTVVAFGDSASGKLGVVPPATGTRYTAVAAGHTHSVLLQTPASASFAANGGTGAMTSVTTGGALPASTMTRAGHTFAGWSTAPGGGGTTYADGAATIVSATPVTLYAQWQRNDVARLEISGPTVLDENDPVAYEVEGFDEFNFPLGDVTDEVTFTATGGTAAGDTVTFDVDPAHAGETRTETITATLDADPTVTETYDVDVESVVQDVQLVIPTSAAQGSTITVTVEGLDDNGDVVTDVTDHVTLTSDVATDQIVGNTVTFPTASPHTITATTASGLSASFVVQVIPTATMAVTGSDPTPALLAALALLGAGLALTVWRRRTT